MRDSIRSFAKMAMASLLQRADLELDPVVIARLSFDFADAMEREYKIRLSKERDEAESAEDTD